MLRLVAIAGICTFLLIPIAGYSSNIIKNPVLLGFVSFGLAYVALPALLLHLWPERRAASQQESIQGALWSGNLKTVEYQVSDVAEIEEVEDEGMHFLLATEGGTLVLSGQYLYGLVESGAFPCYRVRLFSNRQTGMSYGIEPVGQRISDWRAFQVSTDLQSESIFELEDGRVYAKSIEEMTQELHLVQVDEKSSNGRAGA